MKNRIKYPLSIFIVWHPEFSDGSKIANDLYSTFCRNVDEPLSRGLGIPVYYRSKSLIPIDFTSANKYAIVLLIDQHFVIDKEFQDYSSEIAKKSGNKVRVYPVSLCKQATGIGGDISKFQFIRYDKSFINIEENYRKGIKKIKSELLHDCARLLMNMKPTWEDKKEDTKIPSPIKIFLSHAKKDGEGITKKFKEFIESKTKLDVFFDTVDIANGYEFDKQIETNIDRAALVVFHTDEYSSREWCRIEVLVAKRHKCPIVVVHDLKKGERRAFPYLGNMPTTTIKDSEEESFNQILDLTLFQVLNNRYQAELLQSFIEEFSNESMEFVIITTPPELFNYTDLVKMKEKESKQIIVLYPDPPLGTEELKVLNDIDERIKFITPMYLPTL